MEILMAENVACAAEVKKIIAEQLSRDVATITDESTFDSLGADSLDRVEIVLNIEEACNVELDDEAVEKLKTVQELVAYVASVKK